MCTVQVLWFVSARGRNMLTTRSQTIPYSNTGKFCYKVKMDADVPFQPIGGDYRMHRQEWIGETGIRTHRDTHSIPWAAEKAVGWVPVDSTGSVWSNNSAEWEYSSCASRENRQRNGVVQTDTYTCAKPLLTSGPYKNGVRYRTPYTTQALLFSATVTFIVFNTNY